MNNSIKTLQQMLIDEQAAAHPNFPRAYIPIPKHTDKTANGLTQCIMDYIRLRGGQAERISIMGRPTETATGIRWDKSHMTRGTADISAIVGGRAVKIEVKKGRDRQSEAQRCYQSDVERAGGLYYIARDFDSFVEWYNKTFAT